MDQKNNLVYDYLIVGQGLAGTSLAFHLQQAGKKVLIVGDSTLPSSSKVAAGIFNPLTGKKLVKTWMADDIFPYARQFYHYVEEKIGVKVLHETSIFRPYRSIEEQNSYMAQSATPGISKYISDSPNQTVPEHIHAPFGGMEVVHAGWVDLPLFLEKSKVYFEATGQYCEAAFQPSDVSFLEHEVCWNDLHFQKVILCQGYFAVDDTWFNWLPFTPVKGQVLEVEIDDIATDKIVNQGIFILPVSGASCRVGATYSWENLNWLTTENAKIELEDKLKPLLKVPYRITGQSAGIRPSSHDRRPMMGMHPENPRLGIFNGLGTKGVTLAPFFANHFTEYLEKDKELNDAVNIKRYFSLYFH